MRKRVGIAIGAAVSTVVAIVGLTSPVASASPNQGVTATTIKIGIPYIDFASLSSQGVKLTQGSFPDAYAALIANINAHGGINGRKIVAYYEPVNLSDGTVGVNSVCTTLTEDDNVFVAMSPYMPNCYLVNHGTPTLNATFTGTVTKSTAANFTLTPPPSAFDPVQLSVYDKMGVFKGKKVGLVAATADQDELKVVTAEMKKLHVNVVQTAVNSAPTGDQTAANAQDAVIIQRFKNDGINEVVAVGSGSAGWPEGLANSQSTYNPPWIALNDSDLSGYIAGSTASNNAPYLKTMTTAVAGLTSTQIFGEASIQNCVSIIKKAYPNDMITPPSQVTNSDDHSYVAPESACQNMAMFEKIAGDAGRKLTVASFTKAGYAIRNVVFPGSGGPVSFGPGQDYALGPMYIGKYSVSTKQLVFSTKSVGL